MIDFVISAILVVLVGSALAYIIKSRKNGIKCIGCPDAKTCSHSAKTDSPCGHSCGTCTGCNSHTDVK